MAPAGVLPVDRPKSFWQCVEMITLSAPGVLALILAISSPNSDGMQMPTCSSHASAGFARLNQAGFLPFLVERDEWPNTPRHLLGSTSQLDANRRIV